MGEAQMMGKKGPVPNWMARTPLQRRLQVTHYRTWCLHIHQS